jgi:hypothetical protein
MKRINFDLWYEGKSEGFWKALPSGGVIPLSFNFPTKGNGKFEG